MLRLWQLISPALPIGAYAYSQGLEAAVEADWVNDENSAQDWISGQLQYNIACLDIPVLARLYQAWSEDNTQQLHYWTQWLYAAREAAELQLEDQQLGGSLARLLSSQTISEAKAWQQQKPLTFASMFALAGVSWQIPLAQLAQGYLWAWCENQVAAAIKLVPLGQTAGQNILSALLPLIPSLVEKVLAYRDDEIGVLVPAVAIACARHETQYSRLFRS